MKWHSRRMDAWSLWIHSDHASILRECMVTVYPEWLRAPETPVNIAELDAFGVTACLCACKAASDAGRQLGNCEESIDAGRQVSISSNDQLLAGVHEKHFAQRYRYFSKFDKGVRVDFEGWYSVCPEVIAIGITETYSSALTSTLIGGDCQSCGMPSGQLF